MDVSRIPRDGDEGGDPAEQLLALLQAIGAGGRPDQIRLHWPGGLAVTIDLPRRQPPPSDRN